MVNGKQKKIVKKKETKARTLSPSYILRYLDASIVLSSILAGFAILTTLRVVLDYFDEIFSNFTFLVKLLSRAFIVIITCIRFYHGNTAWHRERYSAFNSGLHESQVTATHLTDLYVHVIQYLLFAVVGFNIYTAERFFLLLAILSFTDVLWTGLGWSSAKGIMKRALSSWCLLNLVTGTGALIVYLYLPAEELYISLIALIVYSAAALIDYLINPELFFGIEKS